MSNDASTLHRSRWAAAGAAVAVVLCSASLFPASARIDGRPRSGFVPITACRVIDTRKAPDTVGPRSTPLGPQESYDVMIVGTTGNCTIPSEASGVIMNVTAIGPNASSFLTVYPSDEPRPMSANLNWVANQPIVSNLVTTALSADGRATFYNLKGTVDLAVDIVGYFVAGVDGGGRTIRVQATIDDAANGAALLAGLAEASSRAPSAMSPVVVELEPGTYTTTAPVTIPAFVSLVGSGASNTFISAASASAAAQVTVDGPATLEDVSIARAVPGGLITVRSGTLVLVDAGVTMRGSNPAIALPRGAGLRVSGSTMGFAGPDSASGVLVDATADSAILVEDSSLTTSYKAIDVASNVTAIVRNSRVLSPSPSGAGIISGPGRLEMSASYVEGTVDVGSESCRGISTPVTFLAVTCP